MDDRRATAASWHTKPLPSARKELLLDGVYTEEEFAQIRGGFVPRPGDKWFIYFEDDWLRFFRSATGTCVFQLHIVPDGDGYAADKALVNRDTTQYRNTDDEYDVTLMSYLVDTLLLGRFMPFPTPDNLAEADEQRYREHVMGESEEPRPQVGAFSREAGADAVDLDVVRHENGDGQE